MSGTCLSNSLRDIQSMQVLFLKVHICHIVSWIYSTYTSHYLRDIRYMHVQLFKGNKVYTSPTFKGHYNTYMLHGFMHLLVCHMVRQLCVIFKASTCMSKLQESVCVCSVCVCVSAGQTPHSCIYLYVTWYANFDVPSSLMHLLV